MKKADNKNNNERKHLYNQAYYDDFGAILVHAFPGATYDPETTFVDMSNSPKYHKLMEDYRKNTPEEKRPTLDNIIELDSF